MKFLNAIPVSTYYAYFDLKNATIHILDGYTGPDGDGFLVNNAGTNEAQTLTMSGTPATGSYSVSFKGATTTVLSTYTAAALQAALRALTTINGANVTVTLLSNVYTITFSGTMNSETQPLVKVVTNSLFTTGPVAITTTVVETVAGVPAYAIGTSTITVDTGTDTIPLKDRFTITPLDPSITGDGTIYTVTAETGAPTTSLTFEPALTQAVQNNAVINFLPHDLEVRLGEGSFTFTEKKPREYKKNRGKLDSVRNGDEEALEVKLDFAWIFIKSSSGEPLTVEDVLKQQGFASDWVTAGHDPCEPYCVTMRILYAPTCPGVATEVIDLAEFRYEELQHDTKTGMIACTGKCNLTLPTVTRV